MPKIKINDKDYKVSNKLTVLQACQEVGIEIPHFCFHQRLSIAGNCRMCLVEMEPSPNPVASCAMPVVDGMKIRTNSPKVEDARKGVMEFLLINHPLDCPICDQGGECDLQDQAMAYGEHYSRYIENKRAVSEKNFGPLIKSAMTRCIHCTRCIRFATEIAGVEEMGATGRGEEMEVGNYVEKSLTSELSGNMIDLCPVGALTSKPNAFSARSWELSKSYSIDVMDAVGSNIIVYSKGSEVMRILPKENEEINEEWISDKARFSFDGLKLQRLDRPYVRVDGKLKEASWKNAFETIKKHFKNIDFLKKENGRKIAAIAGDLACCESIYALKKILKSLKSPHMDCRQDGLKLSNKYRTSYVFNSTIAGIDRADFCLLIGTNPRHEAPIINSRIRKRFLENKMTIANIGPDLDLTYPIKNYGNNPQILSEILSGEHQLAKDLDGKNAPMLILGQGALSHDDGEAILGAARELAAKYKFVKSGWNGFNVLHTAASTVGGLDLGFLPGPQGLDSFGIQNACESGEIESIFLLNADKVDPKKLKKSFVIYIGHHGNDVAQCADVILPSSAYTEKAATYVNTEGRIQLTNKATQAPGDAQEDWKILRALSDALEVKTNFNSLKELRLSMGKDHKLFRLNGSTSRLLKTTRCDLPHFGKTGKIGKQPFTLPIKNFYITNSICASSPTMAKCSKAFTEERKQ